MRGNPLLGWAYLWRGFEMMRSPGLRRYVALPLLLNAIVMGFASVWGIRFVDEQIGALTEWLPSWLSFLYWVLMPLAVIFLVLAIAYSFSAVLTIIAGPLNGLLSEQVEKRMGGSIPDESILKMTIRTLGRELTKVAYYLPRYLLIFIMGFIPVLQFGAPFLWFWFGAWMMALQYADYSFDNHARPFKEVREVMATDTLTVIGFGALVSLLLTIPVVNWFVMPAAVIGATLMRIERWPFQSGNNANVGYAETNTVMHRLSDGSTKHSGR